MKTKSKIPDRWLNYSPIGTPIAGTRFIAFKVPLKIELCKRIRPNAWFTPEHLLHNVGRFGSQLGLLIDLTNTDRYYDPSMLTYSGVEYAKIFCAGHEIPNLDVIRRFYAIIDKYEELYENKDLLIGVHCTHGVNRTGYLICRYLIERMGWSAEQALTRYGEARGHEIERKPYIHDLYQTEKYPVFTEKELTQNSLEEPGNTKKKKRKRRREKYEENLEDEEREEDSPRKERKDRKRILKKKRSKRTKRERIESESSSSESTASEISNKEDVLAEQPSSSQSDGVMQQAMFQMMAMQQYWMQQGVAQQQFYNAPNFNPAPVSAGEPARQVIAQRTPEESLRAQAREAVAQAYHHRHYGALGSGVSAAPEDNEGRQNTVGGVMGAEEISSDETDSDDRRLKSESPFVKEESRDARSSNAGSPEIAEGEENPEESKQNEEVDEEQDEEPSASKRRRERRKRLKGMFKKMKKGNFWEIQEMRKEKYDQ